MTKKLFFIILVITSFNTLAQSPILSNFRVEEANKDRIYFESSEPITGTTVNGFYLSDDLKIKVTGLFINSDQLTGHYFTCSEAFDYWDTYAIRYEGGSDIQDLNSNKLHDFWLTEVENKIPEPAPSGTAYFVRTSGDDSNDGLSHETAFRTINRAVLLRAKTIYVEAGDYGIENITFNYKGTATEPVILQGYKTLTDGVPDEIEENYWKWGEYGTGLNCVLDPSEMPTLTGNNTIRNNVTPVGRAFRTNDFLIIKNFQITRFNTGFFNTSSNNLVLKNINVLYAGRLSDARGYAIFAQGGLQGIDAYNKYININTAQGISMVRWYGGATLVDNVKVYNDRAERAPDYYISNYEGSNNIIKNSLVDKIGGSGGAHGIGFKGGDNGHLYPTEYNLVTNCVAINMIAGVELRHSDVKNNVVRDFLAYSRVTDDYSRNGLNAVVIRDESSGNKIENSTFYRQHRGIYFTDQSGEQGVQTPGFDNTFRNILIYDSNNAIGTSGKTSVPLSYGNKFENLTINNVAKVFWTNGSLIMNNTNSLTNSTISNCQKLGVTQIVQSNNNYYNNGVFFILPSGTNITEHAPDFINENIGDFHLRPTSVIKDAGIDIVNSNYDKDGVERIPGKYSIGAYDDAIPSVGSVGPDVSICLGESTTLVASGGTSYDWNTGETTPEVTVSPTINTTYTVVISDGSSSTSYDIEVEVNEPPSVDAGDDVAICEGDSIELTATGVGEFLWNTGETSATIIVSPLATTTYSVTSSNACSTEATDEIEVTVNPAVTLDLVENVSICSGDNITLTVTTNGDVVWSTGETTPSITVNPSSTTIYTVTSTLGDCTAVGEVEVLVNDAPSVDLGDDVAICEGESVELTANGVGDFLWSTGETSATIMVNPLTTTTYTVTASNSCATDATDEIEVVVNPAVTLDLVENVTICEGDSIELMATTNGDVVWSTGETTPTITVNPSSTTIYTVTSMLGDCSANAEVEVLVNDAPTVNAGIDASICEGETIELTATGVGEFLWSTGETTATITVSPVATTIYTVTASNSCATDATDDVEVVVNPAVTLDLTDNTSICEGDSIELTATSNGDVLWSTGETTPTITVSPTSSTLYTVTSTLGDCSTDGEIEIIVNNLPSVDAGPDTSICSVGETVELTATGSGDFLWSTGETTATIVVAPSSTTTYTVTSSSGCSNDVSDEVTVTVYPELTLDVSDDVLICSAGETVELTATGNGDFLWSTGETSASITVSPSVTTVYTVVSTLGSCLDESRDVTVTVDESASVDLGPDLTICSGESITLTAIGLGDFVWSTGETTSSIVINPTVTTTYSITASNACSANVTDEIVINITPEITLDAGSDVAICSGETVELTATGTGPFNWNTGETTASINVSPSSTTTYTVSSGTGSCAKTDDVVVMVNESPSVNLGNDINICFGESVTLTASGTGDFLWSTGETTSSITVNPILTTTYSVTSNNGTCLEASDQIVVSVSSEVILSVSDDVAICSGETTELTATGTGDFLWSTGETTSSILVSPTSSSVYTVSSGLGSCKKTENVRVSVNQISDLNVTDDISICLGETVELVAMGSGPFNWSTGETTASINVNPSNTTTYVVSSGSGSCIKTDEVTVTVNELATVNAGVDVSICLGESATLTATGSGPFNWSTGENTASITVSPTSKTTYTVSTGTGSCLVSDDIVVTVGELAAVDLGEDQTICEGETITLTATGSGDFLWNTGETTSSIDVAPFTTTLYSVTASNSCSADVTDEIIVNVNRTPVANANDDIVILSGSSIDLTVSGVGSFEWSTGEIGSRITVNPTETTTYLVTATTGEGCSVTDEVLVTVVDEYAPTRTSITVGQDLAICPSDIVIMEAPQGTEYLWSSGETTRSVEVSPSETTIYSVKVYNGDDSETFHSTITVTENCTDISSELNVSGIDLDQEMTIYPNPTKGLLNIKLKGYNNDSAVSVYNLNGTMIYSRSVNNKLRASVLKEQLDLSKFPKGIYFVKVNNKGKSETKKVIVM